MPTPGRKSAWDKPEEKKSSESLNHKVDSDVFWTPCLAGLVLGLLCGAVALATIVTLWLTTPSNKTSSVTSTSQTIATTVIVLPAQCSNYTSNTDGTRNAAYSGTGSSTCDNPTPFGVSPTWVRFSGAAGTQLATAAVNSSLCSTSATGWYAGVMPSSAGTTNNGTVCFNWVGLSCWESTSIFVTNCNGYYVYYLSATPSCSYRYCTD